MLINKLKEASTSSPLKKKLSLRKDSAKKDFFSKEGVKINPVVERRSSVNQMSSTITQKSSFLTLSPSKSRISSGNWCLYDSSTKKYSGFRQNYRRQIASLTKVMTVIVGIEFMEKYQLKKNLMVKVTESSSKLIGTTANLQNDTWLKLMDLFYGAMLPSGNDAAQLICEVIGYFLIALQKSIDSPQDLLQTVQTIDLTKQNTTLYASEFIRTMNRKASDLNMLYTNFSNPHGLSNALNLSTAKDMILLSEYASQNQLFREVMNTKSYDYFVYQDSDCTQRESKNWKNTNKLLDKGWEGIKTGQTPSAGSCLASVKDQIFIVVLNSKDANCRFSDTEEIYEDYILKNGMPKVPK